MDEKAEEIYLQKNFTWLSEIHYSQYDRTIASDIRAGAKYLEVSFLHIFFFTIIIGTAECKKLQGSLYRMFLADNTDDAVTGSFGTQEKYLSC